MMSFLTEKTPAGAMLKDNEMAENDLQYLAGYFKEAFLQDFRNGVGRYPLEALLEKLVKLTQFIHHSSTLPSATVSHTTSPTVAHSFNIATSPSVTSSSYKYHDTSSVGTPRVKKRKTSEIDGKPSTSVKTAEGAVKNVNCDLVVTCKSSPLGLGKYLLLVEILSHGVSMQNCLRKLCEEMIFVLQAQTEVFGLAVSSNTFYLLHAARDAKSGHIVINKKDYTMYSEKNFFHLSGFQMMTMDIFSILVYGLLKIEV